MEMARSVTEGSLEQTKKLDSKKKKDWLKYDALLDFIEDEYFKVYIKTNNKQQTNKQTNKHTDKQANKQANTTKIQKNNHPFILLILYFQAIEVAKQDCLTGIHLSHSSLLILQLSPSLIPSLPLPLLFIFRGLSLVSIVNIIFDSLRHD